MGSAKVASMVVMPLQAAHLCFETGGILERPKAPLRNAQLGDIVTAFDFTAFYALLRSMPTVSGADPSRLLYDSQQIQSAVSSSPVGPPPVGPPAVSSFRLASLRAEPLKATLDKAINARQNAYFAKYGNAPNIISRINKYYSSSVGGSKPNRLAILSALSDNQASALKAAYSDPSDDRRGVVKTTRSVLHSTTTSRDDVSQASKDDVSQEDTTDQQGHGDEDDYSLEAVELAGGRTLVGLEVSAPTEVGDQFHQSRNQSKSWTSGSSHSQGSATSHSEGGAWMDQDIVNTDYGYRMPFFESEAQNQRAQISLIDQQFAQFMYEQNLPNLATVFQNELNSIDADVYQLQIAYLNTILMSPIAGTVTGIYKNPGDVVRAGEPVFRVEDSSVILLVATLIYPGRISIGSTVTVQTPLFEQPGPPTPITGKVVAIRGEFQDNQWEVIVQCNNLDSSSHPRLPLGYHFDYDDTTVTIS